ncbi:MAG: hypothetical protein PHY99_04900 [Bacteroidales bacterium]|nr:hypothetical protein [Bacteroidales bacterium]
MKIRFAAILILLTSFSGFSQSGNTTCACCKDEYKQFDFWIGDWVVYANAEMVGFNKITKIESDCILRENWKSVVSSHTGSSYNFYDRNEKKWKHTWIGSNGVTLEVKGEFRDNKMSMISDEIRDEKGNRIINKITWFVNANGTVRQLWEQTKDGGLTYLTLFDGLYRRRK